MGSKRKRVSEADRLRKRQDRDDLPFDSEMPQKQSADSWRRRQYHKQKERDRYDDADS